MEKSNWFLNKMLLSILHDYRIPKVQVERNVQTVLSIFIENIVQAVFKNKNDVKLISNEFPFKKQNNQSINADFLLQSNNVIYIVELKTSSSSYKLEQLGEYIEIKNKVEEKSAKFLSEDLNVIQQVSKECDKYEFLIKDVNDRKSLDFGNVNKVEILYIGPEKLRKKLNDKSIKFISYTELSKIELKDLENEYDKLKCWEVIRKYLMAIDLLDVNKTLTNDEILKVK